MNRVSKCLVVFVLLFSPFLTAKIDAQIEELKFDPVEKAPDLNSSRKTPTQYANPTTIDSTQNPDDLIHFGDLIDVDVIGSIEYDWRGSLTPEGDLAGINFTQEPVFAACKSPEHVAEKVARDYARFLNNPKIVITILDRTNRSLVRLFGAVNQPRRFRIRREVHLNELLIIAGGITEKASGEIQILRRFDSSCGADSEFQTAEKRMVDPKVRVSENQFINVSDSKSPNIFTVTISDLLKGKKAANPKIYYGDLITVIEAEPIYVTGAVENPTKLSLRTTLTVSRAIASAGGLTKGAKVNEITIFRRNSAGSEIITVDLDAIENGTIADLKLQPFDVVDVSGRGQRRSKIPPIIQNEDISNGTGDLPLTVID